MIHCRLAWATRFKPGLDHARAALELAEELDDDVLRARARAVQAILGWFAGEAEAPEDLPARVREFPSAVGGEQLVQEATLAVVNTLAPLPKREEARALARARVRESGASATSRGAPARSGVSPGSSSGPGAGSSRPSTPLAPATSRSSTGSRCRRTTCRSRSSPSIAASSSWPASTRNGRSTLAEEQFGLHPPQHMAVLGLVALWSGDRPAAVEWLDKADRQAAELGWGEPSVRWWSGDHVELLLELGRIEDAARLVDVWEADAARVHASGCWRT